MSNLSGAEFYAAMTANAEQTVIFEVRDCGKIGTLNTKDYRVIFCGVPYDITFIDRVQYAGYLVKIKAELRGDGNGKT